MKGTVTNWRGVSAWGFITGDDGKEYFLMAQDVRKCHKGIRVEFDVIDDGREHLRAVNVIKLSHGTHHPFISDLKRIEDMFRTYVPNTDPEKVYALEDFQMLYRYFSVIEDVKEHPNVRWEFRDGVKKETV